jgi:hypothetical protein
MSKKDIRSCTNTRWRNLTDNNKTSYLKQQTDDGAAKARIFANNKLTHERRKCTQYIFNSSTPTHCTTHAYYSLLILSAHLQTTTPVPAHLKLTALPSQQLPTVTTNSSLAPCLPPHPKISLLPTTKNTRSHTHQLNCLRKQSNRARQRTAKFCSRSKIWRKRFKR